MWIRIQSALRCETCSELTPVNAVVDAVTCDSCGARLDLGRGLWTAALDEWVGRGGKLDEEAHYRSTLEQKGGHLVATVARMDARCPHCDARWPTASLTECPGCKETVSVREPRAALSGSDISGLEWLVGEDRMQLAGQQGLVDAETLTCSGCGAPLTADGSTRRLICGSCSLEAVLPDEIWRRVHEPTAVGRWYLWLAGEAKAAGLSDRLGVESMACDAEGRIYVAASYGETQSALLAIETDPLRLRWMVDLGTLGFTYGAKVACGHDGRLVCYERGEPGYHWFDRATGAHLGSGKAPEDFSWLAPAPDGTLLLLTLPGMLVRISLDGRPVPLWPASWAARLWSSLFQSPPRLATRMNLVQHSFGTLCYGHDGELRATSFREVGRFGPDGTMRWRIVDQRISCPIAMSSAPVAAAADGTTWLFVDGAEDTFALAKIVGGRQIETLLTPSPETPFQAMTVTPDGRVWVATRDGGLSVYGSDGALIERHREPDR